MYLFSNPQPDVIPNLEITSKKNTTVLTNFIRKALLLPIFIALTTFIQAQCPGYCNMIGNGEFEDVNANCEHNITTSLNCWSPFTSTPDLFGRNCVNPNDNIPTNAFNTDTPIDTWNNDVINNNHFLGLYGRENYTWDWGWWTDLNVGDEESVQTTLLAPLQGNHVYEFSMWVAVGDGTQYAAYPSSIAICGATGPLAFQGLNYDPSMLTLLGTHITATNEFWTEYTMQFTCPAGPDLTQLVIGFDATFPSGLYPEGVFTPQYIMIDNVQMREVFTAPTLSIAPSSVCLGTNVSNLAQFISNPTLADGVFSGPGVTLNGSSYDFNASTAGVGTHTITYTYESPNICFEITDEITVNPSPGLSAQITHIVCTCANIGAINLTVTGGTSPYTYSWSATNLGCPGFTGATTQDLSNLSAGNYTVVVTDALGCTANATYTVLNNGQVPNFTTDQIIGALSPNYTSQNYLFDANLIITSAANFFITSSTIRFTEGHGIIIEPGGKLTVQTNSLLSNYCNHFWDGIQGQANGSIRSSCTINNSTVEYARMAFRNYYNLANYGGLIRGQNSFFINNERDLEIRNYTNNNTNYGGGFVNCDFRIGGPMIAGANYTRRINLFDISKMSFDLCDIINTETSQLNSVEHFGVYGYKASVRFTGCTGPSCLPNMVTGFTYGFFMDQTGTVNPAPFSEIERIVFTCHRGVYMRGQPANQVLGCAFNNLPNGFPSNPPVANIGIAGSFAIYQETSPQFQAASNTITQSLAPTRYGIIANNCGGTSNSWIYKNIISNQTYAVTSWNSNRVQGNATLGVHVQCNDFNFNTLDLWIDDPAPDNGTTASIATPQGSTTASAGNDFTGSVSISTFDDIRRETAAENINYYYTNGEINLAESNVIETPTGSANLCNTVFSFAPGGSSNSAHSPEPTEVEISQHIRDLEHSIGELQSQLVGIVDGGNTSGLLEMVRSMTPDNAESTHAYLLTLTPNLSDAVLIEAIRKEHELPAELLVDLLTSNPSASRSSEVRQALAARFNQLTAQQVELIARGENTISLREDLEWQIASLRMDRSMSLNLLWDLWMNNEEIMNPASKLEEYLMANHFPEDRYWLAQLKIESGNYEMARTLIQEYPEHFTTTENLLSEHADLLQLIEWKEQLETGAELSEANWDIIHAQRDNGPAHIAVLAGSIAKDLKIGQPVLYEHVESSEAVPAESSSSKLFAVFPNPAVDQITLDLKQLASDVQWIQVYDRTGKLVMSHQRLDKNAQYQFSIEELSQGAYTIQLFDANGLMLDNALFVRL